jgi:lysophospholipase L1-like esterase
MADPEHAGFGGERIDQVAARLDSINETPDVVLLHIGTNDLYQRYQLATINARLDALIADMRARWPHARIIVATVGPYTGSAEYIAPMTADAIDYNDHVRQLQGVTVAEMPLTPDMIGDGVHPLPAGYVAMAETWRNAIVWRVWLPWVVK